MAKVSRGPMYRSAQILGWIMLTSVAAVVILLWLNRTPDCLKPSKSLIGRQSYEAPPCMFIGEFDLYEATLSTSLGDIKVVLAPEVSPTAVNSFVFLAIHGWYDGTIFHRIEFTDDHVFAQAGAATPDGKGNAGFVVEHEIPSPILRYVEGALVGVVSGDPLRLGSQFFIVGKEWTAIQQPNQDPIYPPLGRIYDLDSLQIAKKILLLGTEDGTPKQDVYIDRISVVRIDEDEESVPVVP